MQDPPRHTKTSAIVHPLTEIGDSRFEEKRYIGNRLQDNAALYHPKLQSTPAPGDIEQIFRMALTRDNSLPHLVDQVLNTIQVATSNKVSISSVNDIFLEQI